VKIAVERERSSPCAPAIPCSRRSRRRPSSKGDQLPLWVPCARHLAQGAVSPLEPLLGLPALAHVVENADVAGPPEVRHGTAADDGFLLVAYLRSHVSRSSPDVDQDGRTDLLRLLTGTGGALNVLSIETRAGADLCEAWNA